MRKYGQQQRMKKRRPEKDQGSKIKWHVDKVFESCWAGIEIRKLKLLALKSGPNMRMIEALDLWFAGKVRLVNTVVAQEPVDRLSMAIGGSRQGRGGSKPS